MSTSRVNVPAAVILNRWLMSPLVLFAGVTPPVGTTVPVPAVRVRFSVLVTGTVPTNTELTDVVLVYVIELAAVLELRNTAADPPAGSAFVIVLPFALTVLRIPR